MEIAHIAHSARCALLLDGDGVCRWYVLKAEDEGVEAAAKRCVGAQFVATLDAETPGLLGHAPKTGTNLLLARVDDGRVSLVRFGPLTAFESLTAAPSVAPPIEDAVPEPEESDVTLQRQAPADDAQHEGDERDEDDTQVEKMPRTSGFAIRVVRAAEEPDDVATHRFEREIAELEEEVAPSKRRGVLPKRRSG